MKRYTLRILLCLLLGVVTTVGVSWWCAIKFWQTGSSSSYRRRFDDDLGRITRDEWEWLAANDPLPDMSYQNVTCTSVVNAGYSRRDYFVVHRFKFIDTKRPHNNVIGPSFVPRDNIHFLTVTKAGWPFNAMQAQQWRQDPHRNPDLNPSQGTSIPITPTLKPNAYSTMNGFVYYDDPPLQGNTYSWELGPPRVIPFGVVFPDLIFNITFYSLLWLCLLLIPLRIHRVALRMWRFHHGRCPICTYNLRGKMIAGCPECGWNREEKETKGASDKEKR